MFLLPLSDTGTCWCSGTGTCRRHRTDAWPRLSCLEAPDWPAQQEAFPGTYRPQDRRAPRGCWSRLSLLNTIHNGAGQCSSSRVINESVRLKKKTQNTHLLCPPCCQRRSSLGCLGRTWQRTRSGWSRCRAQRTAPACLWSEGERSCDPGKQGESPKVISCGIYAEGESAPTKTNTTIKSFLITIIFQNNSFSVTVLEPTETCF